MNANAPAAREEVIEYSNFASVVTGEGAWAPAGFPLPDGSFWKYSEPDAVVIVQDGFLRVAAVPYTRRHDSIQILDNAKHMYFSTRSFECPKGGSISFSLDLSATIVHGAPGDLYDAFVSFNVLDFSTGAALDFFVGNDVFATVYAKLPFPGVPVNDPVHGPRHFCLFEEMHGITKPGQLHHFEIAYDSAADRVTFIADGKEVRSYSNVPVKLGPCTLALGLMSEKDIMPGKGSVSCRGQGAVGKWGNVRIVRYFPAALP
ncbi:MAG TPA: DUF6081 family protein [Candidatus Binataceae bacterium]|nr:DUF6081 family protein [Candidatus Binataceae bacterium]